MASLDDTQGLLSQSAGSVSADAGPTPKRTKLRMGDLSPAKCINPMGVRMCWELPPFALCTW
eukprot:9896734-Alexandrium_andersonii.AAC.1